MKTCAIPKSSPAVASWKGVAIVGLCVLYSSGNPFVDRVIPIEPQYVCLALFFGFLLLGRTRRVITTDFAAICLVYAAILAVQCVHFSFYPAITIAGFFTRLFIGYAAFRLVDNFPNLYVRVMVGLAVLSLAIHIPYVVLASAGISIEGAITRMASFLGTISNDRRPLLLHTFLGSYSPRNSGMFGEPGMFSGYLCLALLFLSMIKKEISKRNYRRYLVFLSLALLTTFSTTGYVVYPLILLMHYDWKTETKKMAFNIMLGIYVILPVLIGGSFALYNKMSFLGEKIDHQLDSVHRREGNWYCTRMGSLVFDWEYVRRRPLTGWGLHSTTRFAMHPWLEHREAMGNGMSDFTARFGVSGMLIWLWTVFMAMMRSTKRNMAKSLLVVLILILLLQGECFLNFALFIGLMFLRVPHSSHAGATVPVQRTRRSISRLHLKPVRAIN